MVHSADIYKNFVSVIKPITGFKITQAFIDDFIETPSKKFQNQIVITPPQLPAVNYSFDDNSYNGDSTITIEIFASKLKDATTAYDLVCDKILSNKSAFIVQIRGLGDTSSSSVNAGGTNIHIVPIIVSFGFDFNITV